MRLKNVPAAVVNAQLPQNYEAAKMALAACDRIDECKDWADKAAALASYAKMADDKKLEKYATRVRARAIRRCGELLQTIEKSGGGRPSQETRAASGPSSTRTSAAKDAGMSGRRKKTALRVAAVPEEEFDAAVDSDTPPTISDLAEQGTKKRKTPAEIIGDRDPRDFQAAAQALGALRRFVEMTQQLDPAAVVRGSDTSERAEMADLVQRIPTWITNLTHQIGEAEHAEKAENTSRRTAQG